MSYRRAGVKKIKHNFEVTHINQSKLNIIIDTDPGTDDALALSLASVFFKDNIRALVSSFGNTGGEQTYLNMMNLAGLLNIDCGFVKGSLHPLGKNNFIPTDYHGENGLCGLILPSAKRNSHNDDKDFLQNLYDIIKEYKNIKYIALGPLTNFASLLDRFPDALNHIGELIIMGGGFDVSNVEHDAEYNFSADPAAVGKVLACPATKVLAPLDMTHQLAFSLADIEDITGIKSEELHNYTDMSDAFAVMANLFFLNYDTAVNNQNEGAIIHDATTLAYLFDKSKCAVQAYKIISDEYGAVSKQASGHDVFVIEKIDRDFVKDLFEQTFREIKKR